MTTQCSNIGKNSYQIFFATRAVLKTGEYSRIFHSFSWGIFGHMTRLGQSRANKKIWWMINRDSVPLLRQHYQCVALTFVQKTDFELSFTFRFITASMKTKTGLWTLLNFKEDWRRRDCTAYQGHLCWLIQGTQQVCWSYIPYKRREKKMNIFRREASRR